jgi:hypothetical protein
MDRYRTWRTGNPGGWLAAALLADLLTYVGADRSGVLPWLLLDLWLTYRVWRGGSVALFWFGVMQTLGACLFGLTLVLAAVDGSVSTAATPATVVCFAVSAWCLKAPALRRHAWERRLPRTRTGAGVGAATGRLAGP